MFYPSIERLESRTLLDGQLDLAWGQFNGIASALATSTGRLRLDAGGNLVGIASGASNADVRTYDDFGQANSAAVMVGFGLVEIRADGGYVTASLNNAMDRYDADGNLLGKCSGGHLSTLSQDKEISFFDLAASPNGDIIAAGRVTKFVEGVQDPVVDWQGIEIYSSAGQLKRSIETANEHLHVFPDGRILGVAGNHVVRLLPGGDPDPDFGAGTGEVFAAIPGFTTDIKVDQYGRIYVLNIKNGKALVTRLRPKGTLDTTWGSNGTVDTSTLNLEGGAATLGNTRIAVAPDGTLFVAQMFTAGADNRLAAARVRADTGAQDLTWGTDGIAAADITNGDASGGKVLDMIVLPGGDLVVDAVNKASNGQAVLVRFDGPDGPREGFARFNGDSTVHVVGTEGNDVITIRGGGDFGLIVVVNDKTFTFGKFEAQQVSVLGGDGDDYIDAREFSGVFLNDVFQFDVVLEGERGNDVIVGSQGADRILGGDGNDRIHGWSGNDWCSGNAQKDRVNGGDGKDIVAGNGGRDFLVGEAGNDTLTGGDQPDTLFGGTGNDSLMGEGGHDRIDGGSGLDFMSGGGGDDTLFARDQEVDTIVGGLAGHDRAQFDAGDSVAAIEEVLS